MDCRFRMLAKALNPATFRCAGDLDLRANQLSAIRAVQRKIVRKMLGFMKAEEADLEAFMSKTNRTINHLMHNYRVQT